jgi:hypothetical protein
MKAMLMGLVLAESDDIVEEGGYRFPLDMVRTEWLKKAPRRRETAPVPKVCSSTT